MSRLIDADDFKKFLQALCKAGAPYEEVVQLLDKQPTAFDTEKVIAELKDMRLIRVEQCHGDYEIEVMTESNFDDAIDIVKKGGVE